MKKYKHGYTQGVFDMFHIGHLNLINNAKKQCEFLTVAVNSDELVCNYKHHLPVIPENNRKMIVENIKSVDNAIIANTLDKVEMLKNVEFDVIFIGDDWKGDPRWVKTEEELAKYNIDVIYLPYTQNVSSTLLNTVKNNRIEE